jgi:hypothetical protein
MEVHLKRKHPLEQQQQHPTTEFYQPSPSTNSYQYNDHLFEETRHPLDSHNFMYEPSPLQQPFPSIFLDNYYYFEFLEHQKKQEKRARERKFYQMINQLMCYLAILNNNNSRNNNNINIPIPYSPFSFYNNSISSGPLHFSFIPNFNTINKYFDINSSIDPKNMPIGHKIHQCKICTSKILLPIFDFEDIISLEKFEHNCIDNSSKYYKEVKNDKIYSCDGGGIYDSLESIIKSRLNSEKILLEIFLIPDVIIQNPSSFLMLKIIQDIFDLRIISEWIFKFLNIKRYIDLGEINLDHWAYHAYNSQNGIRLEKEELQSVVRTLNATFGLITFEINNSRKFMFCFIPLTNELR